MIKELKILLAIVILSFFGLEGHMVFAQQEPQYTQYMYNTQVINPAYVGSRGSLSVLGLYRNQWVGLDGAPETINFSANSPIGVKGVGVGVGFVKDEIGPMTTKRATADFSYTIPLNEKDLKLAFGVKAGVNFTDVNGDQLNWYNPNDPSYDFVIRHKSAPVFGAGFYLYDKNWYVGLSSPSLFATEYTYDDTTVSVYDSQAHFYLSGGYVFNLTSNFKLKPAAVVKVATGTPWSGDFTLNALFYDRFTIGAGYRYRANSGYNGLAGFQITDQMMIGYAYDFPTGDLSHYNNGSHEVFLRFELGTRSEPKVNPRFF